MIRTLSSSDEVYERVSAEGMDRVKDALKSIAQGHMEGYFFELSACEQSCLGGPLLCHVDHSEWRARSAIRRNMDPQDQVRQAEPVSYTHLGVKVHESFWSQGGMELQWEKEEDQNAENRKRGLS